MKDNNSDNNNIPIISDAAELLQLGIVKVPIPKSIDCDKWSKELSTVTPLIMAQEGDGEYAFYRNILEEPDFPFDAILSDNSIICQVLQKHFGSAKEEIQLDDAFCIHYNMEQDNTSGAKHMDPCDITINMCLHKSSDTIGSHVLFYGTRPLSSNNNNNVVVDSTTIGDEKKEEEEADAADIGEKNNDTTNNNLRFLVNQEPGYATIHWGNHPHETVSLEQGERTNIILTYCYLDTSKSDVSMRSCYF